MTAFNIVRFRVKPGREEEFFDAQKKADRNWPGLEHFSVIKTGDCAYCAIAQWTDTEAAVAARPKMIAVLDTFRDTLADLGDGRGITDAISGPVVIKAK